MGASLVQRIRPLAVMALVLGCDPPADRGDVIGATATDSPMVAEVGDIRITVADVEHAVALSGVSPELALRRLEEQALVYQDVRARRGNRTLPTEELAAERAALTYAMLSREVEARITESTLDENDVAQRVQRDLPRFVVPERRRAQVVSWPRSGQMGCAAGEPLRGLLADRAMDLAARAEVAEGWLAANQELGAVIRMTPLFEVSGRIDSASQIAAAFAQPIFLGTSVVGPVENGPECLVGWMSESIPNASLSVGEVTDIVRRQMVLEARARRVAELTAELQTRYPVQANLELLNPQAEALPSVDGER